MKSLPSLQIEREELREKYLKATGSDRKIIAMRGKLLSWAIDLRQKDELFISEVEDSFQ